MVLGLPRGKQLEPHSFLPLGTPAIPAIVLSSPNLGGRVGGKTEGHRALGLLCGSFPAPRAVPLQEPLLVTCRQQWILTGPQ